MLNNINLSGQRNAGFFMQVHLTYDVEIWADGWIDMGARLPAAFRRLTYGPPPHERGALPVNLQILRDNGLPAVFFVEPVFSDHYGLDALQELVGLIMEAGQDVQMHIHPEWLDELPNEIVSRPKKTPMLHRFSLDEQAAMLEAAAGRSVDAGVPRPTASFDPSLVPAAPPALELPGVSPLATTQRYMAQAARRLVH